MSNKGTVLFFQNESTGEWFPSLYLVNVRRNEDGTIKAGRVINGAWDYERRGNEELAKSGNYIVTRWPIREYKEVLVEDSSDYNKIMSQAKLILNKELK